MLELLLQLEPLRLELRELALDIGLIENQRLQPIPPRLVVYPGIVDTELFSIPDNDPLDVPVEPITVEECVRDVLDALERDAVEVYTPAHFKDFAVGKANDIPGFLAGTAQYVQQQKASKA